MHGPDFSSLGLAEGAGFSRIQGCAGLRALELQVPEFRIKDSGGLAGLVCGS